MPQQLQRISYTQTEVGIMNEIADYLGKQSDAIPAKSDYVASALKESLKAKAEMLKKLLGEGIVEGVIEDE